jgi:putative PIN family toxin of toxin-antitoxin system
VRIVLDTNVLISAIFFSGPPSRILSAWIEDRFELAVSAEILSEYGETATRIGERFPGVGLAPLLDRIAVHACLVIPVQLTDDVCADREDVKFLECAVAARARFIVTGDRALLRASGSEGIEIVSPRRFLDEHLAR